ncbi:MAG: hypothetical protein R3C18_20635 [Planctomycetaceae bacterium]
MTKTTAFLFQDERGNGLFFVFVHLVESSQALGGPEAFWAAQPSEAAASRSELWRAAGFY